MRGGLGVLVYRANGVDDMFGGEIVSACYFCGAGIAATQSAAFFKEVETSTGVNCAILFHVKFQYESTSKR